MRRCDAVSIAPWRPPGSCPLRFTAGLNRTDDTFTESCFIARRVANEVSAHAARFKPCRPTL